VGASVCGISDVSEPLARAKVPTPVVPLADQRRLTFVCSTCKEYNCSAGPHIAALYLQASKSIINTIIACMAVSKVMTVLFYHCRYAINFIHRAMGQSASCMTSVHVIDIGSSALNGRENEGSECRTLEELKNTLHVPLTEREVFAITKSWKTISSNMTHTGIAMFLR